MSASGHEPSSFADGDGPGAPEATLFVGMRRSDDQAAPRNADPWYAHICGHPDYRSWFSDQRIEWNASEIQT
jgi:hypothetical protein